MNNRSHSRDALALVGMEIGKLLDERAAKKKEVKKSRSCCL
jgi:hypothetical protein